MPTIMQPPKNFPDIYGTRRFITVFTRARHWSLSWARSIQSAPPHPFQYYSPTYILVFLVVSFLLTSHQYPICIPSLHSCYMSCPSDPPWLDHSNYVWRGVQIMKLLIMQFFLQPPITSSLCDTNIFSSAPCSQTPSVYIPPLKRSWYSGGWSPIGSTRHCGHQ
jgi:hypothetical protein